MSEVSIMGRERIWQDHTPSSVGVPTLPPTVLAEAPAGAAFHALKTVVWIEAKAGLLSMQERSNKEATAPVELGLG